MGKSVVFKPSDAWLLLSIAVSSGNRPVALHKVIAAGDGINHAIFTEDELLGGLQRLVDGGWIE